jgi:starch-binding outer membrane protein, SusD/RagB family
MLKVMKKFRYTYLLILVFTIFSCDDLLELEPKGEIIAEDALKTKDDLQELLNSAYDVLSGTGGNFLGGRSQVFGEVMGDNIDGQRMNNADLLAFYNKTTSFFTGYTQAYFKEPYFTIYRANTLLENIDKVGDIPQSEKDRMTGEALFLRAIAHFDLIKLFAQPYGYTADNSHLGVALRTKASAEVKNRSTVAEVYNQIVEDLESASTLLPASNSVYATSWAAKAILSKVYFHMHNFQDAYTLANDVLENSPYQFNTSSDEFVRRYSEEGSEETIFSIVSTPNTHRGSQLSTSYRTDANNKPTLNISRDLFNIATTDSDDKRGELWYDLADEGSPEERIFLLKFNEQSYFNVPLIHATEVKFIRAESAAEINQTAVAVEDINDIKQRAGIALVTGTPDIASLLNIIRTEKRKELVGEGVRFHDLRRIGALEKGDLKIRGARWDCPGMVVQFPDGEIAGAGGREIFTPNEEGGCN